MVQQKRKRDVIETEQEHVMTYQQLISEIKKELNEIKIRNEKEQKHIQTMLSNNEQQQKYIQSMLNKNK